MEKTQGRNSLQSVRYTLGGSVAVAILTVACYRLHFTFGAAAPLYLLVVLFCSLTGDLVCSAIVSVAAIACLHYYFVDPLFSLWVTGPLNAMTLLSLLVTALVITVLVSRIRTEANDSKLQKERLARLYGLAQQLLALEPDTAGFGKLLQPFQGVFGIAAVCMFDAATAELYAVGQSRHGLARKTRDAYISGKHTTDASLGLSIYCLRTAGRTTGAIGFEGLQDPAVTSAPLIALAAVLLERSRAFQHASAAAAAAEAEIYRSAILDALAHEFKTPIATILAASGAIRAAGPLGPEQLEMTDVVESEAVRLGGLTSRLLHTAELDRKEVKPQVETTGIASLIESTVDRYLRAPSDRRISIVSRDGPAEAIADPELIGLALSQLIDNACRYSTPGSIVTIEIDSQGDSIAILVSNSGSSIPDAERQRIFERYYRGTESRASTSGSGLGLYVARKIALAHGGDLDLANAANETVTFRLSIPKSRGAANHAVTAV